MVETSQLQFHDRYNWHCRGEFPQSRVQKTGEVPQVQYNDKVVNVPVVMQRLDPTVQTVQKMVEVPQIQYVDKDVGVPVVLQRQMHTERRGDA